MEHGRGREGESSLVNLLRAVQERKDLSSNEGIEAMRKIHEYGKKGARFSSEILEANLDGKKRVPYVQVHLPYEQSAQCFLDLKHGVLYYIGVDAQPHHVPEDQEEILFGTSPDDGSQ